MAYVPVGIVGGGHRVRGRRARPPRSAPGSCRCRSTSASHSRPQAGPQLPQEPTCIRQTSSTRKTTSGCDLDGDRAHVGITDYAQKQLGDVVYLELPEVGRTVAKGDVFGTIESVKAVSELYAPVGGEVVEVNSALTQKPETVNRDPHDSWMIVIKVSSAGDGAALLDAAQYTDLTK